MSVKRHDVPHDRKLLFQDAHDVAGVEPPALLYELPNRDLFPVVQSPRFAPRLRREPRQVEPRLEVVDVLVAEGAVLPPHAQELRVARVDLDLVPPVGVEETGYDEVLIDVGQVLGRCEAEFHPEVGGAVLGVVVQLDDHRRNEVDRQMHVRVVGHDRGHGVVVADRVQADPREEIGARRVSVHAHAIERLVLVPEESDGQFAVAAPRRLAAQAVASPAASGSAGGPSSA